MDENGEAQMYCVDERHGTPCPLPCRACEEECDPKAIVTPLELAIQWQ